MREVMTYAWRVKCGTQDPEADGWCDSDKKARRPESLIASILERKRVDAREGKHRSIATEDPVGRLGTVKGKPEDFASTRDGRLDA